MFVSVALIVARDFRSLSHHWQMFLIKPFDIANNSTQFWFLRHILNAIVTIVQSAKELFKSVWKGENSSKRAKSIQN